MQVLGQYVAEDRACICDGPIPLLVLWLSRVCAVLLQFLSTFLPAPQKQWVGTASQRFRIAAQYYDTSFFVGVAICGGPWLPKCFVPVPSA